MTLLPVCCLYKAGECLQTWSKRLFRFGCLLGGVLVCHFYAVALIASDPPKLIKGHPVLEGFKNITPVEVTLVDNFNREDASSGAKLYIAEEYYQMALAVGHFESASYAGKDRYNRTLSASWVVNAIEGTEKTSIVGSLHVCEELEFTRDGVKHIIKCPVYTLPMISEFCDESEASFREAVRKITHRHLIELKKVVLGYDPDAR